MHALPLVNIYLNILATIFHCWEFFILISFPTSYKLVFKIMFSLLYSCHIRINFHFLCTLVVINWKCMLSIVGSILWWSGAQSSTRGLAIPPALLPVQFNLRREGTYPEWSIHTVPEHQEKKVTLLKLSVAS